LAPQFRRKVQHSIGGRRKRNWENERRGRTLGEKSDEDRYVTGREDVKKTQNLTVRQDGKSYGEKWHTACEGAVKGNVPFKKN